jgi:hypothetical protein
MLPAELYVVSGALLRCEVKRQTAQGRATGLSLALTLVPMIASGALIQTAVDASWRQAWVVAHLVSSGLWVVGFLVHQVPVWIGKRSSGASRLS